MHSERRKISIIPLYFALGAGLSVGAVNVNPTVAGNTISWPDNGWYQVQDAATYQSLCEGGVSCEVSLGTYKVINLSTGERFPDIVVGGIDSPTSPTPPVSNEVTVTGNTISWLDDGWYQVQDATTYQSVCEGGLSCVVSPGTYTVINLSTGERFGNIVVGSAGSPTPPTTPIPGDGTTVVVTWLSNNYFQVQNMSTGQTVCEGDWRNNPSCELALGTYRVINLDTGERFDNVVIGPDFVSGSTILEPYSISVSDSTISWTRGEFGTHEVKNATTLETVCSGGSSCAVAPGNYLIVNGNNGDTTSIRVSNNGNGGMKLNQPAITSFDPSGVNTFNFATWDIDDGLTTTNGLPNGGSTTSSLFAGSGAGVYESSWGGADRSAGIFGPRISNDIENASMLMWINGEQVGGYLNSVFPAANPTTTDFTTESMSGLQVTLQYHAVKRSSTMRHYTTMRNDTDADIVAVIDFASNPYSLDFEESSSRVNATSSDDSMLGTNDRWVVLGSGEDDVTGGSAVTKVLYGPGSPRASVVSTRTDTLDDGNDGLQSSFNVVIPARSERSLLFFYNLSLNRTDGEIEAQQFNTTPAFDSALVEGLSQEALSEVLNWDF